jgi:hypothetical protein
LYFEFGTGYFALIVKSKNKAQKPKAKDLLRQMSIDNAAALV